MSCTVPDCDGGYRLPRPSIWALRNAWRAEDDPDLCRGHRLAELEAFARFEVVRGLTLDELDPERVRRREAEQNAKLAERLQAAAQARHTWGGDGSAYGVAALAGVVRDLAALAPEEGSGRNHALNRAAYSISGLVAAGELEAGAAMAALKGAAERLRLPTHEAQATIRSGWEAGRKRPRLVERRPA